MNFSNILLQSGLPSHLTPRNDYGSMFVVSILLVSIFIIALARLRERNVFIYLVHGTFLARSLEDLSKEEYKAGSTGSVLFTFLFVIVTAGAGYWLFFVNESLSNWNRLLLPVFFPAIYLFYQLAIASLASKIFSNQEAGEEINYFTLIITQFFALVLLCELFLFYFQTEFQREKMTIIVGTYIVYLAVRFLRGFWIAFSKGVSWYYIILYFWTLEILPLLIILKLLYFKDFQV